MKSLFLLALLVSCSASSQDTTPTPDPEREPMKMDLNYLDCTTSNVAGVRRCENAEEVCWITGPRTSGLPTAISCYPKGGNDAD